MTSDEQPRTDAVSVADLPSPELRSLYRAPAKGVIDKVVDHVGPAAAAFIAQSPLLVMATGDGSGLDASPRGGPPGFVRVLGPATLAFGDLVGNNRLDSYENLQANPSVGLIFFVPGAEETVRVNGTAVITDDEAVRAACALDGRVPRVAVVIAVEQCYLHCGAALRRARLWDQESWPEAIPSGGAILAEAVGAHGAAEAIDADLAAYYDNAVWELGGTESP